jgi:hypothetical protein
VGRSRACDVFEFREVGLWQLELIDFVLKRAAATEIVTRTALVVHSHTNATFDMVEVSAGLP